MISNYKLTQKPDSANDHELIIHDRYTMKPSKTLVSSRMAKPKWTGGRRNPDEPHLTGDLDDG